MNARRGRRPSRAHSRILSGSRLDISDRDDAVRGAHRLLSRAVNCRFPSWIVPFDSATEDTAALDLAPRKRSSNVVTLSPPAVRIGTSVINYPARPLAVSNVIHELSRSAEDTSSRSKNPLRSRSAETHYYLSAELIADVPTMEKCLLLLFQCKEKPVIPGWRKRKRLSD